MCQKLDLLGQKKRGVGTGRPRGELCKRVSSRRGIANLTAALFFLCRSGSQILVQSSSFPVKQTLGTIVTSGESVQMTGFNLQAILRAMSPRVKGEEKSENFGDSPNLVKMNVAKHKSNFGR